MLVEPLLHNNNGNPTHYPMKQEESGIEERPRRHVPPESGRWRNEIDTWLEKTKKKHRDERRKHKGDDERRIPMPYPYLRLTREISLSYSSTGLFGSIAAASGQPVSPWTALKYLQQNQPGLVATFVGNMGNVPSWTCYTEIYEGPAGLGRPLSDYELRDRRIITIQPGVWQLATLSWVRHSNTGQMVLVCYDPLLDPKGFSVIEQYNRHIALYPYYNLS